MAKTLKAESDRHWQEGIGALKKYIQRGGSTSLTDTNYKNNFMFRGNVRYVIQLMLLTTYNLYLNNFRIYHYIITIVKELYAI